MARKSKKPGIKKLQINLTNRWLYTLIVFFSLIVIGIFVYAVAPNPGHDIIEIAEPTGCSVDQFLQWTGTAWTCTDVSDLWGQNGSNIYYDTGKVGIGTTNPLYSLHVNGDVKANLFIGDGSGLVNVKITVSNNECNENTHGILRYISGICNGDDIRSSFFDICMRTGDTTYAWSNIKTNSWADEVCDLDGCPPGTEWYECKDDPGCYEEEPEYCYTGEPAP